MTTPAVQDVLFQLAAGLIQSEGLEKELFRYEASGVEANQNAQYDLKLAALAADQTVSLAQFTSLLYVIVFDRGGTGLSVGKAAGAGKFTVQADKFMVITESAPFTLYIDNPSATDPAYVDVVVIGNVT